MSYHHRLPRDLGGSDNGSNIVSVDLKRHEAWHRLFGTLNPYRVVGVINSEFLSKSTTKLRCYNRDCFIAVGQQGCKDQVKRKADWKFLFGEMTTQEIAKELSQVWLPRGTVVIAV